MHKLNVIENHGCVCLSIVIVVFTFLSYNCQKQVPIDEVPVLTAEVPVLTTSEISNITATTATSGGNIASEGSSQVIARGVCWSTTAEPTIADNKTTDNIGGGSFISRISGLTINTKYNVRAYATNNAGTAYGNNLVFAIYDLFPLKLGNEFYYQIIGSTSAHDYVARKYSSIKWFIKRTIIKESMQNNITEYTFEEILNGTTTTETVYLHPESRHYDTTIYKDKKWDTYKIIEDHQTGLLSGGFLSYTTFKRYQNVPAISVHLDIYRLVSFAADLGMTKSIGSGVGNASSWNQAWYQDSVKIVH